MNVNIASIVTALMSGALYCDFHKQALVPGGPPGGNRCGGCIRVAIEKLIADEREACARVAEDKGREHTDLARQFTRRREHRATKTHEQYALVCCGSDGVASRIRARGKENG